jgi:hypothetical protein
MTSVLAKTDHKEIIFRADNPLATVFFFFLNCYHFYVVLVDVLVLFVVGFLSFCCWCF